MAVLNKYHHGGRVPDGAINIMRGTEWGNPFPVGQFTREDSIALYRELLWRRLHLEPGLAEKVRALHGRALADGGTNDIGNIELLCGPCNLRKHAKDPILWAQENGRLI